MFHQSAALFYYESCLSGSSFKATVLLRQTGGVSFKCVVLFPYSAFITYLDVSSL